MTDPAASPIVKWIARSDAFQRGDSDGILDLIDTYVGKYQLGTVDRAYIVRRVDKLLDSQERLRNLADVEKDR